MKKTVSILLILVLVFALCACGSGSKGPNGTYVGRSGSYILSTVTFNSNGTFTEQLDGETDVWTGTWTISGNQVSCTYDDGSHDSYVWDSATDTLDWKGEGQVIYSKSK